MRKKNKYICQHCGYHLRMESFDRIESLIDAGTWDSMDENMVSTDPYEILRKNLASASDDSEEFMKSQEAKSIIPDIRESVDKILQMQIKE